jgi:MinD-like ATPase involved in chromosome partitioning or flagellar assembly
MAAAVSKPERQIATMSLTGDPSPAATPPSDNAQAASPEQTPPAAAPVDQATSAAISPHPGGSAAVPLAAMPPSAAQPPGALTPGVAPSAPAGPAAASGTPPPGQAHGGIRGSGYSREQPQQSGQPPRDAGAPGPAGDRLSPLERAEGVLPRRTGGASRLTSAFGAFVRGTGAHAKNSSRRASAGPDSRQPASTAAGPASRPAASAPGQTAAPPAGPDPLLPAADQAALSRAELNRAALDRAARAWTAAGQQLSPQQVPGQRLPGQRLPGQPAASQPAASQPDAGELRGQRAAAQAAPSAAALTRGLARPDAQQADFTASGNLLPAELTVSVAPSRLDRFRNRWRELDHVGQLDALITGPRLQRCATIAMVSPKGGVGKTTITALLGTLFSQLRRDPTVAVDTNPDFGSLGRVLTPDQSWYVDDLAALVAEDDELSLTALDSHLGRAVHGLLVVPAPTDPDRMAALDEDAYARVIARLKDFFSLILLDCGTGLQDPASAAAIAAADQVVLLTDAQPATASLVAESAELLHQWDRPIIVVVNRMPARGAQLDVQALSQYLPAARGLVVVPDDVPAAGRLAGGSFDWRDAPASWQLALRRLAVVLVSDWQRLGLSR